MVSLLRLSWIACRIRLPLQIAVLIALALHGFGLFNSARSCANEDPKPDPREAALRGSFAEEAMPLLTRYCVECHGPELSEADIRLDELHDWPSLTKSNRILQKIAEQLRTQQMPPPDSDQPTEAEHRVLSAWLANYLTYRAEQSAGDPGPVVLRRLNNAEYTYTLRDITGLSDIDPAREFPADSAAGEGFSNTGAALVMSPALVRKYLDAAKQVSQHVVLLPDRIAFSSHPSVSDLTNEKLDAIRGFYARYTDASGGEKVNLQGIVFETNQGGRLPIERYLKASLQIREALQSSGGESAMNAPASDPTVAMHIERLAHEQGLSAKYLSGLWDWMQSPANAADPQSSRRSLVDSIRQAWRHSTAAQHDALLAQILGWQRSLFRFSSVGHIGKVNGPKAWQEPVEPIRFEQELRLAIPPNPAQPEVTVYLQITDAGDGAEGDVSLLDRPRLILPGGLEVPLRDLDSVARAIEQQHAAASPATAEVLTALDGWLDGPRTSSWSELANAKGLDPAWVEGWARALGIRPAHATGDPQRARFSNRMEKLSGYDFVTGWGAEDALSVVANASNDHVRVPGNMPPKSVGVHPSPSRSVVVAFRSPVTASMRCNGMVRHAHTECGNGIAWRLEVRRGALHQTLASGFSNGANAVPFGPLDGLRVREGEEIALVVEPRDGNHSCDLTNIELEIASEAGKWSLTNDIVDNILAGNPHADASGRPGVWEFFSEAVVAGSGNALIPSGSALAAWLNAADSNDRLQLAERVEQLIGPKFSELPADSPDRVLAMQLRSPGGPFFLAAMAAARATRPSPDAANSGAVYGLAEKYFSPLPDGTAVPEGAARFVEPGVMPIRLPSSIAAGAQLAASGRLHPVAGQSGSVQFRWTLEPPAAAQVSIPQTTIVQRDPNWSTPVRQALVDTPILVAPGGSAQSRIAEGFAEFRKWFPIALCYPKIVPVDEVVTLTLFYREDEPLKQLMLSDTDAKALDRLWDELHFVSRDALKLVDAYEQLWQFATQDADPSAFEPLREPIQQRANAFKQQLVDARTYHLESVLQWAAKAFRRPLSESEAEGLALLYSSLRRADISHEEAIRLLVARILVSPEFLYRLETPGPGADAQRVSALELANRISYFLWSSSPDDALMQSALDGTLRDPAVLRHHALRMLADPRAQRMAVEFGCMWLHIRDLDQLNEKSETHFPEFTELRQDLYQEAIHFLSDAFQNDGTVMGLLTADHAFVNERLARFYGIPKESADAWQKIEGVRAYGRGGILTLGAVLAKQSGASRTSPILRGNWLCEVLLGEKLPKPPKNVPVLSEVPPQGVSERQLIEQHSSDPACAKCHRRIDPYGFALEGYDAIGRFRWKDVAGQAIDTSTQLPDGTQIRDAEALSTYLATTRAEEFVKQFNRKLLGYALGRSVQLSDEPFLASLYQRQKENDYNLKETVITILLSPQFQGIRGREHVDEESGAQ
ncbi:MAG: DUF1592 domain-containing protein [Pirellula sp.]